MKIMSIKAYKIAKLKQAKDSIEWWLDSVRHWEYPASVMIRKKELAEVNRLLAENE